MDYLKIWFREIKQHNVVTNLLAFRSALVIVWQAFQVDLTNRYGHTNSTSIVL